jgi:ectoine hydroxylase-related dioxygenase (phytanoyl-CoA dioxygenase family)
MLTFDFGEGHSPNCSDSAFYRRLHSCYGQNGHAILGSFLPREEMEMIRDLAMETLAARHSDDPFPMIDHNRTMLTLPVDGRISHSPLFTAEHVQNLFGALLGPNFILSALGVVLSFPGSNDQRIHRDQNPLFTLPVDTALPPYAVTLGMPLVDMVPEMGGTSILVGSNRQEGTEGLSYSTPILNMGSGYLFDYRALHFGQANRSRKVRPLLTAVFSKPWWRDWQNFEKGGQKPIEIIGEPAELSDVFKQRARLSIAGR